MKTEINDEAMKLMAELLKTFMPPNWEFTLLTFEVNTPVGKINYISSAEREIMKHTIQGKEVNIHWEQGELIEKHDSGCAYYHVTGTDDNFKDYTGVGNYQSGELEDVTEIEKVSLPYKMLGEKCIAIEVPNGSFNHKVIDMTFVCKHNDYDESHTMVKLPSSGFKFLSTSKDMTPQLLEKFDQFNTIDELRAWELANGYVTVNPVPQPEAQFDEYGNGGYCETWVKEYEQAQQQVVNIAYLIKG